MKILSDEQFSELHQIIDEAQNIVLTCHRNADGDALGSTIALANILCKQGKDATVVVPDGFPDFLHWLPGIHNVVRYDKHPEKCALLLKMCDVVFCLDYNTLSRTGDEMCASIAASKAQRVMIDHHLCPDIDCRVCVSMPSMSSTSEMVYHVAVQLGYAEHIDKAVATCIYCGMMTDTGAFTYNSNSPEVYHVIAELLQRGIDKYKIYRNVYYTFSPDRMHLWGHVLSTFHMSKRGDAAYFTISKADMKRFNFIRGDAEGLVNMPLQIKGMKLCISLREDTEKPRLVWVSLRSVDDFPCNKMAEQYYGGGGHLNAAGGRLNCSLEEAVAITEKAIEEFTY